MQLVLSQLAEELAAVGEAVFRARYPQPVLLCAELPPDEDEEEDERHFYTLNADWRELRETMELRRPSATIAPPAATGSAPPRPGPERLFVVRKREGGAFAERIGVGRAVNADVSIPLPALSKYHAYITVPEAPGDSYTLTDAGSKNGTWVDGRRLEPKESAPLADATAIRLGPYDLTFLTPEGLVALAQRKASRL